MQVNKLTLKNFRNISDCVFEPGDGINVIYGKNAQGKTNLIEAIWLFCGQKSFRNAKDSNLIKLNTDNLKISLDFFSQGREQSADIIINSKKSALLNEIELSSVTKLGESFCAVVFDPSDMDLIKEGPKIRRDFLDDTISHMRPKYARVLNQYNRAVLQRNNLLKDIAYHPNMECLLDVFEGQIANSGAYLIAQRKMFLEGLLNYAPDIYLGISGKSESFEIKYLCTAGDGDEEAIKLALKKARAEDIENKTTSVGPHRDDIEFFVNDLPLKSFGSQGQRRSAILAIKLSQAELLKKFCGEQPVAILDDVMSELDNDRQKFILNHIKGWQVFITCCDPQTVQFLEQGNIFKMENGILVKEK